MKVPSLPHLNYLSPLHSSTSPQLLPLLDSNAHVLSLCRFSYQGKAIGLCKKDFVCLSKSDTSQLLLNPVWNEWVSPHTYKMCIQMRKMYCCYGYVNITVTRQKFPLLCHLTLSMCYCIHCPPPQIKLYWLRDQERTSSL